MSHRRSLTPAMAQVLVDLWEAERDRWIDVYAAFPDRSSIVVTALQKLAGWGLVERSSGGEWRVTRHGQLFLAGDLLVPRFTRYDGTQVTHEGHTVGVRDCLGRAPDLFGLASVSAPPQYAIGSLFDPHSHPHND